MSHYITQNSILNTDFIRNTEPMYVLLTTYPNKPRDLKRFIIGLVKGGMAACVQKINYVKSFYMREGQLKQEEEKILLIKCLKENKEKIENYVTKNHPYEIPELLRIHPDDVNEAYKKRMKDSLSAPKKSSKK